MFDQALLESSRSRQSTLKRRHWRMAGAAGALSFLGAVLGLRAVLGLSGTRVWVAQALVVAACVFCYTLMLVYVYNDARTIGLRARVWVEVTAVLNLPGFLLYLVRSGVRTGEWRRAAIPAAYALETMLIGALVLIPLVYTQTLPYTIVTGFVVAPSPPPPRPRAMSRAQVRPRVSALEILKAPVVIPKTIEQLKEEPEPAPEIPLDGALGNGVPGGTEGGGSNGVLNSILSNLGRTPPPPAPAHASAPRRIHLGGQVEAARLIFQPKPEYPPLAKVARIQGTVRLEAIISKDGTIENLRVLSGHPLLVGAALAAVARWRYQPTLLNGEPAEVVTEIDLNFTLTE